MSRIIGRKTFPYKEQWPYLLFRQSVCVEWERALIFLYSFSLLWRFLRHKEKCTFFFSFSLFYIRLVWAGTLLEIPNKFLLKSKRYPSELGIALQPHYYWYFNIVYDTTDLLHRISIQIFIKDCIHFFLDFF